MPGDKPVEEKVKNLVVDELDLRREGAVLETGRPYLVPLAETLSLPACGAGKANPKSSTGRLDVFTRVITDYSYRFDEIAPGYQGQLYVEIVPLSFAVRVRQGLALNQLRLMVGRAGLDDDELEARHHQGPLLYIDGRPADDEELATSGGLFLGLDLRSAEGKRVGYRAKEHTLALDMAKPGAHRTEDFWEEVMAEEEGRVVLAPERFYLLLSREAVRVPPDLACEMTAYDPTSGELRTHYAGFFDPGFGYDPAGELSGSRRRPGGPCPRRPVHDRARPASVPVDVRTHDMRAHPALRPGHRLQLPGPGRHAGQALPPARLKPGRGSSPAGYSGVARPLTRAALARGT